MSKTAYLWEMIEGVKSNQPEVKASKLDEWLQSYGHFKVLHDFTLTLSLKMNDADAYFTLR